jgi:FkbM family methyltransferase
MTKCKSEVANEKFLKTQEKAHHNGFLGEREFEVDCFLSILADTNKEEVTLLELGAGYGEWCLALAGVVKNKILSIRTKSYKCFAVEAEPQHRDWAIETFWTYQIPGAVIWGAVSDKNGKCSFSIDENPADCYGQSITVGNSLIRSAGNLLRRRQIQVPCFTLDNLLETYRLEHIDIAHMDVQGAEARVIKSGLESIAQGKIDYWLVGTHGEQYNKRIEKMLSPYYETVVDIYPKSKAKAFGLQVQCQDGIQVFKRK